MFFVYDITDNTKVKVAVESDTRREAEYVLEDWMNAPENEDEIYDLFNRSYDRELVTKYTEVWDDRARDTIMCERRDIAYVIPKRQKKINEPLYSLHIKFNDDNAPYTHREMTMHELASELCGWSSRYRLVPNEEDQVPWLFSKSKKSADGRSTWIWMTAEAR